MKQTICLNMIVKDEAHIICKTFDNLLKYIQFDYYVISDTGSSDGTQELIKNYFLQKGIPGELHEEPWKAFDYNRTMALKHAFGKTDYLFIFDADDAIMGDFKLPQVLTADTYNLIFGKGFNYKRPLLINNKKKYIFKGVLHEFLMCLDQKNVTVNLDGDYFIHSGRVGTRNKNENKYQDDAVVLEKAYSTEQDPKMKSRYAFYCAQSHKDCNQIDKAIEWYTIEIGLEAAWIQERFYSCLTLGDLYERKCDYLNATKYWLKSTEFDSTRLEGVVHACKYYRINQNYVLVDLLYEKFKNYSHDLSDRLFIRTDLYDYHLEFEYSIAAFYLNKKESGYSCCKKVLLNNKDPKILSTSLHNLQFYKEELSGDKDSLDLFYIVDTVINSSLKVSQVEFEIWDILYNNNILSLTKNNNRFSIKNKEPIKIVMTFTTCKRLDLFKKTINSVLNHFEDLNVVDYFYCVDDNSSRQDRAEMQKKYPWIKYYFKTEEEKGHLVSMNLIYSKLTELNPLYWIHMEDDFLFYKKMNYITTGIEYLKKFKKESVRQVLFNRAYGETINNLNTKGYIQTGDKVVIHDYKPDFKETTVQNVYYWPHYSFRPSITDWKTIKELGNFDSESTFFERSYADKWTAAGYKSAYFNFLTNRHIGRLTSERNDTKKQNAYTLNGTDQFGKMNESNNTKNIKIINLKRRQDRLLSTLSKLNAAKVKDYEIIEAVDGKSLELTPEIINLFKGNDFINRKGIIGCALSHIKLWRDLLLDPKNEYYIIMEDDFRLTESFNKKIASLKDEFVSKDLLFLGYLVYSKDLTEEYTNNNTPEIGLLNRKICVGGTHCYSINKNGARKLLEYININGIKHGIDYIMTKCVDSLCLYEAKPMLAFADWHEGLTRVVDSDIQNSADRFDF